MPTLVNPATWRQRHTSQLYAYIHAPKPLWQATLSAAPAGPPYTVLSYENVTLGDLSALRPDMTLTLGTTPGGADLGGGRLRAADSATLTLASLRPGTRLGQLQPQTGAYLTAWDDYRLWPRETRLTTDGQRFMDDDIAPGHYPAQPPPLARLGPPRAAFVDPATGNLRLTLSASISTAMAPGAHIVSYQWDLADGVLVTGLDTHPQVLVDFPPGLRWVHVTVTDSNGHTHTAHRPIFAADHAQHAPLTHFHAQRVRDRVGQRLTLSFEGDAPEALDHPLGETGLVLLWERECYAGVETSLTSDVGPTLAFVGWLRRRERRLRARQTRRRSHILEAWDIAHSLDALPAASSTLLRRANPTNWSEMAEAHMGRVLHHVLQWHSTALTLADFYPPLAGNAYPIGVWLSDGDTLGEQVRRDARAMAHQLAADRLGTLRVVPDALEHDISERTPTEILTLTAGDVHAIQQRHQTRAPIASLSAQAVLSSAHEAHLDTLTAIAEASGTVSRRVRDWLVRDGADLETRTGQHLARLQNRGQRLEISLTHGGEVGLDPVYGEWVRVELSDAPFTPINGRYQLERVTLAQDNRTQARDVTLLLEPESTGSPGRLLPELKPVLPEHPDLRGSYPQTSYPDPVEVLPLTGPFVEAANDLDLPLSAMGLTLTWTESAILRCEDIREAPPTWTPVHEGIPASEKILDVHGHYQSDGSWPLWALTWDDLYTLSVYHCADINATSPAWTLEHSFNRNGGHKDAPFYGAGRIRVSASDDLILVSWLQMSGVWYARRWNGVWGVVERSDQAPHLDGYRDDNREPDVYLRQINSTAIVVAGTRQVIPVAVAMNRWALALADGDAPFTPIAGLETDAPIVDLQLAGETLYAAVWTPYEDATVTLDFDQGLPPEVDAFPVPSVYNAMTGATHPDNVPDDQPGQSYRVTTDNIEQANWQRYQLHLPNADKGRLGHLSHDARVDAGGAPGVNARFQWRTLLYGSATGTASFEQDIPSGVYGDDGQNSWLSALVDYRQLHSDPLDRPLLYGGEPLILEFNLASGGDASAVTWWADNLRAEIDAFKRQLWRLNDISSTPSVTALHDAEQTRAPAWAQGLAVDRLNAARLSALQQDSAGAVTLTHSENEGDLFSLPEALTQRLLWLKRAGALLLLGGEDALMVSVNGGASLQDRRGDLAAHLGGTLGTLRGALTVWG